MIEMLKALKKQIELRAEIQRLKEEHIKAASSVQHPVVSVRDKEEDKTRIRQLEIDLDKTKNTLNEKCSQLKEKEETYVEINKELILLEEQNKQMQGEIECLRKNEVGSQKRLEGAMKGIEEELMSLRETLADTQMKLEERDHKFEEANEILGEVKKQKLCVERELECLKNREKENQRQLQEAIENNNKLKVDLDVVRRIQAQKESEEKKCNNCLILELELKSTKTDLKIAQMKIKNFGEKENIRENVTACFEKFKALQDELQQVNLSHQKVLTEYKSTLRQTENLQVLKNDEVSNYREIIKDNSRLRLELSRANDKLKKKTTSIENLKKKLSILEECLTSTGDTSKNNSNNDSVEPEIHIANNAYEILMEASYPFQWEHLLRKARTFATEYNIPYDFELDGGQVIIKNLILSARTKWQRLKFILWIEKLEKEKKWSRKADQWIVWEVEYGSYYDVEDVAKTRSPKALNNPEAAINIGTQVSRCGVMCPRVWRKTLVQRHMAGLREDCDALTSHFNSLQECRVNVLLGRLSSLLNRLQLATELAAP